MPTEFEWKIFPGIMTLGLFNDTIIFMSMYNDIERGAKGNKERCEHNSQTVANYAPNSLAVVGLSWGLDQKRNGAEPTMTNPTNHRDQTAENMMANFSGSGHPRFRASGAFQRGELRSKEHGKKSIHFNGSDKNIELLLRTIISANQLSVYGAIADLCKELSEESRAPGKPEAPYHLEKMEIPTNLSYYVLMRV